VRCSIDEPRERELSMAVTTDLSFLSDRTTIIFSLRHGTVCFLGCVC